MRREAVVLGDVVEEVLDIAVKVFDGLGGDKAVDVHVAVEAVMEIPGSAADVDSSDLVADGPDFANLAKPLIFS